MLELQGKYASAKVFTDVVDSESISQVINLLNQPYVEGSKVRMMPDIHAGAGCTIGTTMTIKDKICPNLVGVDIGCGMETIRLKEIQAVLKSMKSKHSPVPKSLAYVEGELFEQYLHDMKIAQRFAGLNRQAMMDTIVKGMGFHVIEQFTTIHNYIDVDNMILRKGSVSAQTGERLLIPINMRDGSLLCTGKGNPDWNFSAPHGAGRLMSRSAAKEAFTVSEFKKQMAGIYTTSVGRSTLDECPMAYKGMDDIVGNIEPAVTVDAIIKPIYNFKAGDED